MRASAVMADLDTYLATLATLLEVIIVDGSDAAVFDAHHARWGAVVTHRPVDADLVTPMGKVGGVLTGARHAGHDRLVIADDDVRWDAALLAEALDRLEGAAVVRPQNCFQPAPWHARWDTGRILLNRALDGDWPGTLLVDRRVLDRAGGYDGSVMFENFELVRTLRAAGGRERVALDIVVPRVPAPTRHFLTQRVRQAYDEFARPHRLVVQLALVPVVLAFGRRSAAGLAFAAVVVAEAGRRRGGGRAAFPPDSALWAPLWVAERAVTSWLAVASHVRHGGIVYRGQVLRAATPRRALRRRLTGLELTGRTAESPGWGPAGPAPGPVIGVNPGERDAPAARS